ncbi:conserved Plasmodium protein [Rhizoctonia solani AG-1 IB]|uniref:Conserved Plasmodium protein n=1 Tax=Thanatephorus cucumeris (strain AG1-IB / isolate 7/3/14) TaxID=1108050 RepID=A0A0B7FBA7_THACB|nr:conserved Plasmodium protein [Rhizoctonia solani AG-1 IB]
MFAPHPGGHQYPGPQRHRTDGWMGRTAPPAYMLVMGSQGCGKSNFINMATGRPDFPTLHNSNSCTQSFYLSRWPRQVNQCEFRFTDTPGFGSSMITDRKILELLIEYLSPNTYGDCGPTTNMPKFHKVAGLLYIHSEDEPLKSRTSRETIETLVKVLGTQFINRVTVLLLPQNNSQINTYNFMPPEDSPIYPLYCSATKPWTILYDQTPQSIDRILWHYIGLHPRNTYLAVIDNFARHYAGSWQQSNVPRYLREFLLGYIPPLETVERSDIQSGLQEQYNVLKGLQNTLTQKEEEIKSIQSAHKKELENIQTKRIGESFDHETELKRLNNIIQDQKVELSKLSLGKDLGAKELETLKNEIRRLSSDKISEINRLQEELRTKDESLTQLETSKNEEISKLTSAKDLEIERLKARLQVLNDEPGKLQAESEREIRELTSQANAASARGEKNPGGEVYRLNAELRRVKAEYASLRNHTQLQENTEQAAITTALDDINRLIEELVQSLAERIEEHLERSSPKQTLNRQDLLSVFSRDENGLALKAEEDTYLLFEYAIQATVCDQLYAHLFRPFHPSIAEDEKCNKFITEVYDQMIRQEPQSIAGRWRRDTFSSISKKKSRGDKPDDERMHRIITEALSALVGKFIKIQPHEVLEGYDKALGKVIAKAEWLNRVLKEEVSILGNFQLISFSFGDAFQPSHMSEAISTPKKPYPEIILATVGLGLLKSYALGGDRQPETTILRKAVVFGPPK